MGRWHCGAPTAGVAVPEAAVNEHDDPAGREHDVRFARQVAAVQAKTETVAVEGSAYDQFRPRVLGADSRHDFAALLPAKDVHLFNDTINLSSSAAAYPAQRRFNLFTPPLNHEMLFS
jgi:hypothetical protein